MKAGKEEGAGGGGGGKNSKERNSRRTRVGGRRERRGASFSFSRTTWEEDRGSVGSKDENVNRLRLLSSRLLSSSKPPHALEPICRGKDIKAARYRDTLGTGDSWSRCCCEITTRGLESGAKWKRKFRWKGDRRNARVARAIREITS